MSESSQDTLAAKIAAKFVENGLLDEDKQELVYKKILSGQLTQDDWSLLFELNDEEKHRGSSNE